MVDIKEKHTSGGVWLHLHTDPVPEHFSANLQAGTLKILSNSQLSWWTWSSYKLCSISLVLSSILSSRYNWMSRITHRELCPMSNSWGWHSDYAGNRPWYSLMEPSLVWDGHSSNTSWLCGSTCYQKYQLISFKSLFSPHLVAKSNKGSKNKLKIWIFVVLYRQWQSHVVVVSKSITAQAK